VPEIQFRVSPKLFFAIEKGLTLRVYTLKSKGVGMVITAMDMEKKSKKTL
jgi:hypothetical protein